jgi:two-component system NtrC family response regulator
MIATVIDREKGSIVRAAEQLGVSRPTLYDLMKKHNLMLPTAQEKAPELE